MKPEWMKQAVKDTLEIVMWFIAALFVVSLFSCSTKKKVTDSKIEQSIESNWHALAIADSIELRSFAETDTLWWEVVKIGDTVRASGGFFGAALLPKRLRWQRREWTRYARRHEGKLRPIPTRRLCRKIDLRRGRYMC